MTRKIGFVLSFVCFALLTVVMLACRGGYVGRQLSSADPQGAFLFQPFPSLFGTTYFLKTILKKHFIVYA